MPSGYVGQIAQSEARAFAEALSEKTCEAGEAAGGWIERRRCVGGVPVSLSFVHPEIADLSTRALATGGVAVWPEVTIRVWDSASTGVQLPPPSWDWHANRYQSDDVIVTYDRALRRLTLVDVARRSACAWQASAVTWPPWERAAPFRDVLDRLLATHGHAFLHAGTLGDDDVAVLLAGPSGSGKSTTTAAGVERGCTTLGDDYVILDPDGVHIHALYNVIRLDPLSPAAPDVGDPAVDHQGKLMLPLDGGSSSAMRSRLRASALLVPTVTGARETVLRPIGPGAALKALAPTSLVQLDPRADSLRRMRRLVEQLPCYALELGSDLSGVVERIHDVLGRGR